MRSSLTPGGRAPRVPARPRLGPYDVRACDLVVPALLVRVERDPDHSDEDADEAEDEADVAEERIGERELAAVRLHHAELHHPVAHGLAMPVGGPEIHRVGQADQGVESVPAHGVTREQDAVQDAGQDRQDDAIDEERHDPDPESGLCAHRNGGRASNCGHEPPPSAPGVYGMPPSGLVPLSYLPAQRQTPTLTA